MGMMKAVLHDEAGQLSWSDVPRPEAKTGEVRIEIYAAALNRADLMQRAGKYPAPEGSPAWMGLEVAGVVDQIGPNTEASWNLGDRVCALLGGGGYAEYVTVREDMLLPVPDTMSFEEAAALPEALATAYLNLFWEGGLKPGETVYIAAGSSGLASIAIPLAKALGHRVITSVRSESSRSGISHLGADVVVNTAVEDLVDAFDAEADRGRAVSVALDCLGGENLSRALPYLAVSGTWVLIAALAGGRSEIDLSSLLAKGLRLKGSTLRRRSLDEKARLLAEIKERLWPMIESREIGCTIQEILPITEVEAAHAILERGGHIGKVVLRVR